MGPRMAEVGASPASPWEDFGQVGRFYNFCYSLASNHSSYSYMVVGYIAVHTQVDTLGFASAGKEGARAVAQEGGFYFDMLQHVGGEGDAVMGQVRVVTCQASDSFDSCLT